MPEIVTLCIEYTTDEKHVRRHDYESTNTCINDR